MERREITVAGIIIAKRQNISKSGKPWGSITLEDYNGSYTFTLFGKDYEAQLSYFQEGLPVIIRCNMQTRWKPIDDGRPAEWEAKIKSIGLLANLKDDIKNITLMLPVKEITDSLINGLAALSKEHHGKTELRVKLLSPADDIAVDLFSRNHRVTLTPDFLSFFEEENVQFKLG